MLRKTYIYSAVSTVSGYKQICFEYSMLLVGNCIFSLRVNISLSNIIINLLSQHKSYLRHQAVSNKDSTCGKYLKYFIADKSIGSNSRQRVNLNSLE